MKFVVSLMFSLSFIQPAIAYKGEPNKPMDLMNKLSPILQKHQIKDVSGKLRNLMGQFRNNDNSLHTSSFFWMRRHIAQGVDISYFDVAGIQEDVQTSASLLVFADQSSFKYDSNAGVWISKRNASIKKLTLQMNVHREITNVTIQDVTALGQYEWDIKIGLMSAFALLGGLPSTDLSLPESTDYLISKDPMGNPQLTKKKVEEARKYYLKTNDLYAVFMSAPRD